jgi:hypothetical protein
MVELKFIMVCEYVVPGAAPEMFINYVSEELTYTLESFAGNHVDLHQ